MKKILIALFTIACFNARAKEDSLISATKNYISVEIDPTPFIFGGYSFSLKYSPAANSHLSFMGSVYSSELPDNLLSKENYDNGFRDVKLNTCYAFFADYFLRSNRTGFHFGPSAFYYSKTIGMEETNSKMNFKSIYPNVRVGYLFHPFCGKGFYLNPWVNFGKEIIVDGDESLSGINYSTKGMSYIVAIHLGYRVTF